MFENLLKEYDETMNEMMDIAYTIKIMAAETSLCIRKQTTKETLIRRYEERKVQW
jgi:hypothetical protein